MLGGREAENFTTLTPLLSWVLNRARALALELSVVRSSAERSRFDGGKGGKGGRRKSEGRAGITRQIPHLA